MSSTQHFFIHILETLALIKGSEQNACTAFDRDIAFGSLTQASFWDDPL